MGRFVHSDATAGLAKSTYGIYFSAMRGLRPGPIEHRVKKIALDNSNNHFADDLANLHISQPCLNG